MWRKDWNVPMRADIERAIRVMKCGEYDARNKAVALLQDSVFSFSMRICGHRQNAEDNMQEVLVKSLPYLDRFHSSKALAVWLYKVAKSRCLMSRRRSKFAPRAELSLENMVPDRVDLERIDGRTSASPEEAAIHSEQRQRLREVIQLLPPHYRIVLELCDLDGLTAEEVQEITGVHAGTIRVRLHRARLFVRKELTRRGEYPDNCAMPLKLHLQSRKSSRNGIHDDDRVLHAVSEPLSKGTIVTQLARLASIWPVVAIVTADLVSG